MIVEIPFYYSAKTIPPRARNERSTVVRDRLPLSIRDLSAAEFPLTARFTERYAEHHGGKSEDIHSDGRAFYKVMPGLKVEDLEARASEGGETPFQNGQRLWFRGDDEAVHGAIPGRVLTENRQERIADLLAIANQLVVYNGKLFQRCGEPVWKKQHGFAYEAILLTPEILKESPGLLHRADRLQEHLADHPMVTDLRRQPDLWGGIDVIRPDLLRLSTETSALRKAAADSAKSMEESIARRVNLTTLAEFTLYANLRDAVAACPEGEVTEDLSETVWITIEALPKESSLGGNLAKAYERWRRNLVRDMDEPPPAVSEALKGL